MYVFIVFPFLFRTICVLLAVLCVLGTITEGLQDCLTPDQFIPFIPLINQADDNGVDNAGNIRNSNDDHEPPPQEITRG